MKLTYHEAHIAAFYFARMKTVPALIVRWYEHWRRGLPYKL